MRIINGLIRLICGLAVVATASYAYLIAKDADGEPELFGHRVSIDHQTLLWLIIASGAVGALLVLGGLVTIVRNPKPKTAPPAKA